MKIFKIFLFVVICSFSQSLFSVTAEDILKKVDENRALGTDFAFSLDIQSFQNDKLLQEYSLKVYVKITPENKVKTLVYFTQPPTVSGRKMLMDEEGVYMMFPNTRNIIRLTPLQILVGDVANGDIMRLNFSQDYIPKIVEENESGWKLELNVKPERAGSTYAKVILSVDKNYKILYGEYYSAFDKLLKVVHYKDYKTFFGKQVPTTVIVNDAIKKDSYSIMKYKDFSLQKLPTFYYTKEYLPRFSPK